MFQLEGHSVTGTRALSTLLMSIACNSPRSRFGLVSESSFKFSFRTGGHSLSESQATRAGRLRQYFLRVSPGPGEPQTSA
eukprot:363692-Rhodomonas_salina.1